VEGETSTSIPVESGVPQWSLLGPSLFLFNINDMPDGIQSTVRLLLTIPLHMSQYHQMQMQQTFNKTLTNWLNGNKNGSWNSIQRNVMYSPSPKSDVHLSTITLYMDISMNMIHQQNTWDVPFHQTSNGVNI
jgi:hypothetical protein